MIATGGQASEADASAFPWDAVLALALGTLRWSPDALWRATPREIAWAAGFLRVRPPATARADLDRLLAAYPDPAT